MWTSKNVSLAFLVYLCKVLVYGILQLIIDWLFFFLPRTVENMVSRFKLPCFTYILFLFFFKNHFELSIGLVKVSIYFHCPLTLIRSGWLTGVQMFLKSNIIKGLIHQIKKTEPWETFFFLPPCQSQRSNYDEGYYWMFPSIVCCSPDHLSPNTRRCFDNYTPKSLQNSLLYERDHTVWHANLPWGTFNKVS